jgi:hypothetical protein
MKDLIQNVSFLRKAIVKEHILIFLSFHFELKPNSLILKFEND